MKVTTRTGFAHYTPILVILTGILLLLTLLAACGDTNPTSVPAPAAPATVTPGNTTVPATTGNTNAATTAAATNAATTTPAVTNTPIPNINIPLTGTPKATTKPAGKPALGTPFDLKINQSALIESENIEVKFLRVLEDSRCPTNVNCVWSGQLIAEVAVTKNGKPVGTFDLNNIEAIRNKDKKVFEDYALTLVKVEPGRIYANFGTPNSTINDTKPEDYVLSFLLAKVTGGTSPTPTTKTSGQDKPANGTIIDIKMNQTASLASDNIEIKFLRVVKDERCPASADKDVFIECYASGPVVVEVAVAKNGQSLGNFQLSSGDAYNNKNKKLFDNYSLTVYDVKPNRLISNSGSPNSKVQEPNPADYVVSLLAIKLA